MVIACEKNSFTPPYGFSFQTNDFFPFKECFATNNNTLTPIHSAFLLLRYTHPIPYNQTKAGQSADFLISLMLTNKTHKSDFNCQKINQTIERKISHKGE